MMTQQSKKQSEAPGARLYVVIVEAYNYYKPQKKIVPVSSGKQMLYVLNIMVRYSLIYVGTKDRQFLTFIPSFDLLFYANHSNVASMKQSIRLTRATLYFKFIAFRVLTSVRAGATPQKIFEKWKRHGETDVKVLPWFQRFFLIFWAVIVYCNA